jgi:hypothetical protein
MPARLHAFVQDADDLDQSGHEHAIIKHVNWPPHPLFRIGTTCVSKVKAPDARPQVWSVSCRKAFGLGSDLAHRRDEMRGISAPAANAHSLLLIARICATSASASGERR